MKGLTSKQYIGGAERTTPLEGGAEAVLGALDLISHRIAVALDKNVTFNEVLSAAYMEKQKMAVRSFYLVRIRLIDYLDGYVSSTATVNAV
jgi:hypothetical protein